MIYELLEEKSCGTLPETPSAVLLYSIFALGSQASIEAKKKQGGWRANQSQKAIRFLAEAQKAVRQFLIGGHSVVKLQITKLTQRLER